MKRMLVSHLVMSSIDENNIEIQERGSHRQQLYLPLRKYNYDTGNRKPTMKKKQNSDDVKAAHIEQIDNSKLFFGP